MIDERPIKDIINDEVVEYPGMDKEAREREIFKAGYREAIRTFSQNVWNDKEIEAMPNWYIIAISHTSPPIMFYMEDACDWKHFVKSHNIERWCYLDDILP